MYDILHIKRKLFNQRCPFYHLFAPASDPYWKPVEKVPCFNASDCQVGARTHGCLQKKRSKTYLQDLEDVAFLFQKRQQIFFGAATSFEVLDKQILFEFSSDFGA